MDSIFKYLTHLSYLYVFTYVDMYVAVLSIFATLVRIDLVHTPIQNQKASGYLYDIPPVT